MSRSTRTPSHGILAAEYRRLIAAPATSDPGGLARDHASTSLQPAVRLALAGPGRPGNVDGAWWPRSRDLTSEIGPLVTAVGEAHQSSVIHLTYDRRVWSPTGRRVRVGQRWVKVGWFELSEPQQVSLTLADGRTVALLVIPPETGEGQAARLLARAAQPGRESRPSAVPAATPSGPAPAPVAV